MATTNSTARRPPSTEYLALSEIESTRLPPNSDKPESRKLLVLDLNGTLVLRSPRNYQGPRTVMPRPFSKTFKEYLFRDGSHLDVMVWSSAQPHSVDSMLDSFFGPDRSHLVGVWARDTLGLSSENYSQKVQTIKDLDTIWNAPVGLPPPVKVMPPPPMAILTDDPTSVPGYDPTKPPPKPKKLIYNSFQLKSESVGETGESDRTGYFETPHVKLDDPIPGLSATDPDVRTVESLRPNGLYSALNSLLLDDSALKAHLQPYNHLTLPEYTADLQARDMRRQNAVEALAGEKLVVAEDDVGEDHGIKVGERGSSVDMDGEDLRPNDLESEHRNNRGQTKHLRAAPYDKTLLAVIGVLDAVQYESSLVGWMKAGGMRPSEEEMERVATLFPEQDKSQVSVPKEKVDDMAEEEESDYSVAQTVPAKRSSDSLTNPKQTNPKRARPGSPEENVAHGSSRELVVSYDHHSTGEELTLQPSKRKRHRARQKPTYPIDHPLSASDPYPFFTDGKSETKLWFQDREIYTYWVRRGLLALKECEIEPEAGIEVNI
ncbi:hypothetical protein B0J17DRAFT_674790 [Rhizoctonia solani]|nr:hypothetical protein B0J17DRAFT_674790 [Rhizoctonia solani]